MARHQNRSGACASGLISFHIHMQLGVQSVAVVTGAGNGVGQAIACHLAKCGCRLVLVEIDHEGLDRTRKLWPIALPRFTHSTLPKGRRLSHWPSRSRVSAAVLIFG